MMAWISVCMVRCSRHLCSATPANSARRVEPTRMPATMLHDMLLALATAFHPIIFRYCNCRQ